MALLLAMLVVDDDDEDNGVSEYNFVLRDIS